MRSASQFKTSFKALLAAAAFGVSAIALAVPTEARMGGFGGFHGGGFGGFHGGLGGFHGGFGGFHGGFARPMFIHPGFRGGFHPAFAGRPFFAHRAVFVNRPFIGRRAAFVHNPFFIHRNRFFFHRHRFFNNNAFAVGLASGAVLGGLYDYGYPYYNTAYGDDCYYVRRRAVNQWGYVVWRRALVCDYDYNY
ncbi:hypothetical protein [Microvirga terricola]|uniref:Uncharacterized protein n=1 Tax=Microvirga terricola TaxID=2719797 RepID=A0ABX0VFQ6_9HYPH|nr:hypothetical protein [Microvirga terricola]NIX77810.1 hypothetical protein [Microvirga terricola]